MARYMISKDEEFVDFSQRFVPDECTVRLPEVNEEPTINPRDGEIGIYTVLFE